MDMKTKDVLKYIYRYIYTAAALKNNGAFRNKLTNKKFDNIFILHLIQVLKRLPTFGPLCVVEIVS